jgi:hypothetical protein
MDKPLDGEKDALYKGVRKRLIRQNCSKFHSKIPL